MARIAVRVDSLWRDVRQGVASTSRSPGIAAVVIRTLGVDIAGTSVLFGHGAARVHGAGAAT
jgi:hypothetical protein